MAARASKLSVRGRVQMVGYRRYVLEVGRELGVTGYVKNEPDGSVTVLAQGERTALKRFTKRLKGPPPPAEVEEVDESQAKAEPRLKNFSIKFGTVQEELQEGLGGMQTEFRDYRGEFRDYRKEFRGFATRTDDNFKALEQKYGEISEKLTRIMDALTEEAKKSREMLEAMREESRRNGEILNESMRLLREAVAGLKGR